MSDEWLVKMPKLGETVTEGTVGAWHRAVGDRVELDDVLFEVSTDKVDSEVPSPSDGVVLEILVPEGETVPVGTPLARMGGTRPAAERERAAVPPAGAVPLPGAVSTAAATRQRILSPLVRRLLAEHAIDAATISGSGAGGRIRREDVERAIADKNAAMDAPPPSATVGDQPAPSSARSVAEPAADNREEVVALSRMRLTIGERMAHSVRTAPHVWTSVEVDLGAVEAARTQHKDRFRAEEGTSLSPLPFIALAVCSALRAFPKVNSSLDMATSTQVLHHYVNLAVAVDLAEQGLVAPVIRGADVLTVRGLARAIATTARRATGGQLGADDLTGSTFTVTSPGPIADYASAPIINQPNSAILSLNKVVRRPVVIGEMIAIRPMTILGFSYDHRAFDGVTASRFMAHVRDVLQDRNWTAELG